MALTARMEQMLAEAPPLTARQRDLIAASFSGVDLGVDEAVEDAPSVHRAPGSQAPQSG